MRDNGGQRGERGNRGGIGEEQEGRWEGGSQS